MTRKRLVLFVEGHGEADAAPILVGKLLQICQAFDAIILDEKPFRVGEYGGLQKDGFRKWRDKLLAARKRKDFGACLLFLDGDSKVKVDGQAFCAMRAAFKLADAARDVGAGNQFSVATVFANQEFESWFLSAVESLKGRRFPDGRDLLKQSIEEIPPNPELSPRDAKGWFRRNLVGGYNPPRDQADLVRLIDWDMARQTNIRSFKRMENAVDQLVNAIRTGQHVVTPEPRR